MFLKNITYLSTFTFLIIFSWVAFTIYNNYTISKISTGTKILITPIPSSFDLDVVKSLQTRSVIQANLSDNRQSASASASITPTPIRVVPTIVSPTNIVTPTSVQSGTPTPTIPPNLPNILPTLSGTQPTPTPGINL